MQEAEEDIKKGLQVRLIKRSMSGVDAPLVNTSDAVIVIETPDESAAAALGTPPNHGVVHGTPDSAAADWLPLTTGTPDSAAADWLPLTTAEVRSVVSGVVGVMIEGIATSMAEISSSSLDFPTQKDDGGERASCTEGGAFEGAQGDMVLEQASNGVEEGGGYREAVVQVVAGIVSAAGDNAASLLSHSVLHAGGDDCKELSRDRSGGAVMGLPASRKTRAKNMAGHDGELGASVVSPEGAGDAGGGDAKGSKGVRGADEDVGIERAPSWVVNHSVPDPGGKAQDAESKGSMNGPGVEDSCVRRIPSIPTGEQGEVALFPVHGSDKFAGNGGMRDGEKCAASDDRRLAEAAAKMDSAKGIMTTAGRGASGGASQGAVLLLEEALAIREEVLGAKHPATCNTKNALGNAYDQEGAHEKALECYEGALEGLQGGGGYGNLGGALRSLGRFDQALGAYEKAVLIDKQTLGPDHIDVAKGEYGLAMTLDRMGRHEQALDMYTDVLRIQGIEYHVEVKGNFDRGRAEGAAEVGREGALAVASTLNNAGLVLERMGRYQEALERLEEAQALRVAALGKAHLDVSATLFNIAIVKRGKGDSKGAFDACEESLSVCRGALGDVHERTRRRLELIKHLESEREQPGGPKSPM
jgi:tetratricopeptide (TPR) repeat protein